MWLIFRPSLTFPQSDFPTWRMRRVMHGSAPLYFWYMSFGHAASNCFWHAANLARRVRSSRDYFNSEGSRRESWLNCLTQPRFKLRFISSKVDILILSVRLLHLYHNSFRTWWEKKKSIVVISLAPQILKIPIMEIKEHILWLLYFQCYCSINWL